jgi:hypothetical protein
VAFASVLASGCGSGSPVGGSYTLDFPTVADAVATDTVQVFLYPYGDADSCQALVEARRTTMMTPAGSTSQTQPVSPCSLSQGSSSLSVPFGNYSFLAIAQSQGADLLLGCAAQTISDTNSVVSIPLTLASETASIPTTACMTLSAFCAKQCM